MIIELINLNIPERKPTWILSGDTNYNSKILDSVVVDKYLYSVISWDNTININGNIFQSDMGHSIANISSNNKSLMLLKIEKETSNILDIKPILYEFSGSTNTGITDVEIGVNYNETKLNIIINNICNNEDTSLIYGNSGLTDYYSGLTNTYNGTSHIEQFISYKANYVQFTNNSSYNVEIYLQNNPSANTFIINEYITISNMDFFDGNHQIKNIDYDLNGDIVSLSFSIPQSKYNIYDEYGEIIKYYNWKDKAEIILDNQTFERFGYNVINYESTDTINITSMVDIEDNKIILGRYKNYVGLDVEQDYANFISGLTTKYIKQTHSSTSTETGPIISEIIYDEEDNIYTFGLGTNFNGITDIQVGDFSPLNQPIVKTSDGVAIISKSTSEGDILWNTTITLSPGSIFDNPKIVYVDLEIYVTFNFSGSVVIGDKTYSTQPQIINSVGFKIETKTGTILRSKFLSSNSYNSIRDVRLDDKYIYFLGIMRGESKFDLITKFANSSSGYILKARKKDGVIINIIDFYSDDILDLKSLNIDDENIYISGSYKGNIYINGKIKYSDTLEYFITNIKKNDL